MPDARPHADGLGTTKTLFLACPCLPMHDFLHVIDCLVGSDLTPLDIVRWFLSRIRPGGS